MSETPLIPHHSPLNGLSPDELLTSIPSLQHSSLSGNITFKRSEELDETLLSIPNDRLLLETDSPDIPPVNTMKPNTPSNILINLKAASEILGLPEEKIAESTTANAIKLFGLEL